MFQKWSYDDAEEILMAHLKKFNITNYDWNLGHCERTLTGEHESHSVDSSLTHLNPAPYSNKIYKGKSTKSIVDERIYNYGLRKNGVCLASWVVQPTDDVKKEDYNKFFEKVARFMYDKYGDNFIRSYVHIYDEPDAKPHSHNVIIPIKDGKFRAKQIFTKEQLLTFHKDLGDFLTKELGYPVNMLNGNTEKDAQGKAITVSKYNSLKYENEQLKNKLNAIGVFEKERKQILKDTDPKSYNALKVAEQKVLEKKPSIKERIIGWLNSIFNRNNDISKARN